MCDYVDAYGRELSLLTTVILLWLYTCEYVNTNDKELSLLITVIIITIVYVLIRWFWWQGYNIIGNSNIIMIGYI